MVTLCLLICTPPWHVDHPYTTICTPPEMYMYTIITCKSHRNVHNPTCTPTYRHVHQHTDMYTNMHVHQHTDMYTNIPTCTPSYRHVHHHTDMYPTRHIIPTCTPPDMYTIIPTCTPTDMYHTFGLKRGGGGHIPPWKYLISPYKSSYRGLAEFDDGLHILS